MDAIAFLPAVEQAVLVGRRELSPVELVEMYLERIERFEPQLGAYVTVCAEEALTAARRAEARLGKPGLPPFHGVPISVKDLSETAGVRTTFSSRAFASYVPSADAGVVRRLKEAGFILLGKTNTPEFGARPVTESELNGVCRNPWDLSRTPGGSSGGAAAALAAGLCPVAHGSDGGGSIRIPASCCGLVGLKPSRGRISAGPGAGELLEGFATAGVIARTVHDAAAVLDVMAGHEPGDPYWAPPPERPFNHETARPPGRLRIGVTPTPPLEAPVDPACLAALWDTAGLLAALGHEVEETAPDWHEPAFTTLFTHVWQAGSALWRDVDSTQLEPLNRVLLEAGRHLNSVDYVKSVLQLHLLARRIVAFWDDHDLLLTPTLALPPVPIGWTFADGDPWLEFERGWQFTPFTQIANVTGQPAISLPLGGSEADLPIGVQLLGPPAGEAIILQVAAQLEAARPWAGRTPPLTRPNSIGTSP